MITVKVCHSRAYVYEATVLYGFQGLVKKDTKNKAMPPGWIEQPTSPYKAIHLALRVAGSTTELRRLKKGSILKIHKCHVTRKGLTHLEKRLDCGPTMMH